ncbi:MAG TPA: AraC family transcriptional regulator ligand-binding domain-containing protein [Polyangiaceae bacterium]|nr:AraC family transcriptional regulator ligand-binding domain-containing protein [Polyangiaceae bacterium]
MRAVVEAVEDAHLDSGAFLAALRFDPERLEKVDGRIEQAEYDALVERTLALTSEPALGLRMGVGARSLEYSLHAHLVLHANSMREGLKLADQYHRLFTDARPFALEEGARTTVIRVTGLTGSLECRRFGAEVAIAGMYRMLQHFVPAAKPELVAFEHPSPPYEYEYTRVFGGMERFEQPFTGLVIDSELMDARQLNSDDEMHAAFRVQAARRLAQLDQAASYADKVREYVMTVPERGHDMALVARGLGLGPRSLRRRLFEEGVTYRGVVEGALAAVATRLLVDERKSIQEAAVEMSFSEPSAFCRAFKRWTGSTPKQYQTTHAPSSRVSRPPG